MPKRRANDAQTERLLAALKSDLSYRQQVARRIAEKDNIKYDSAMRRLQRYITDAGEKRNLLSPAATESRRELRADARRYEPPRPSIVYEPGERVSRRTTERYDDEGGSDYGDEEDEEEGEGEYEGGDFDNYEVGLNDLRAVVGYHDGDVTETAERLGLSPRGEKLLDMGVTGEGADVLSMRGGGELQDAIREFLSELHPADLQDVEDFRDLFYQGEIADWMIGMIVDDIHSGKHTFEDWLDAWRADGMSFDDLEDSEFWELFREAYEEYAG